MSHAKVEKLARMAQQIGEAQAALPPVAAAAVVAEHIAKFWTPKMIAETLDAIANGTVSLKGAALSGFDILKQRANAG